MKKLNPKFIMPLGMLALVAGLLLHRFQLFTDLEMNDFVKGFCIGLSIALNLASVVLFVRHKRTATI